MQHTHGNISHRKGMYHIKKGNYVTYHYLHMGNIKRETIT